MGQIQVDTDAIDDEDIVIYGSLTCQAVEYLFESMLVDAIASMIGDQVGSQFQSSLCLPCTGDCPHDSQCDDQSGVCMEDSGAGCVSAFGGEGAMGGMTLDGTQLEFHHWAGGYEDTEMSGLSLGFDAGFRPAEWEGCTPRRDPPEQVFSPFSPTLSMDESPFGSDYDAAMHSPSRT